VVTVLALDAGAHVDPEVRRRALPGMGVGDEPRGCLDIAAGWRI